VGKPEGKRPLGRPRRRWEDGIRMDLMEIGLGGCGLDSTVSGQGPVAGCCECGDEPSGSCATELVSLLPVGLITKPCALHSVIITYEAESINKTNLHFSRTYVSIMYS
jgi:hypothetical protein